MNWFIIIFFLILLCCGFIFDKSRILPFLIMGIFFIITCFSYDGNDFLNYSRMYKQVGEGIVVNYEVLFVLLMKFFNYIGFTYEQFRMAIVIIELIFIYSTVKKYVPYSSFMWVLFLIYPGWLLTTLLRHSIALSIIVFSIRYIPSGKDDKKNTVKLLGCIVSASLVHSSYWVFLTFLLTKIFEPKKILKIAIISVSAMGILVIVFGNISPIIEIISLLPIRTRLIEKYFNGYHQNIIGILYICFRQVLLICYGTIPVIFYNKRKNDEGKATIYKEKNNLMNSIIVINYCSLFVLCESFFASNSSRLNQVVFVIDLIAWAICIGEYEFFGLRYTSKEKMLLKFIAIIMPFLFSILQCTFESQVVFDSVLKMIFETNTVLRW